MAQSFVLDTQEDSQSVEQPQRRTIYDASNPEIVWKSFLAGLSLGMGKVFANLIFFVIMAALFVAYIEPWLNAFQGQLQNLLDSSQTGVQLPSDWLLNSNLENWSGQPSTNENTYQFPSTGPTQTR